jgi:hypothetical protein
MIIMPAPRAAGQRTMIIWNMNQSTLAPLAQSSLLGVVGGLGEMSNFYWYGL